MNRIITALMLVTLTPISHAAAPTTRPANRPRPAAAAAADDFVISKMRVQQFKPHTYLYKSVKTTFAEMSPIIQQTMDPFGNDMNAHHVQVAGPPVFVYRGITMDRTKPFELEMGFTVAPGTKAFGDYKVREMKPMLSATILYSGNIQGIGAAYQQLYTDLFAAGLTPSGENRETTLVWEGVESSNTIVLVQVGLK